MVTAFITDGCSMTTNPKRLKTPAEILEAALEHERKTHRFYTEAMKAAGSSELCRLLEELRGIHYRSILTLEQRLAALRGPF
ncbi:hypothetical protein ACFL0Q_07785 [Thermodesulfobacteriota bacterium]